METKYKYIDLNVLAQGSYINGDIKIFANETVFNRMLTYSFSDKYLLVSEVHNVSIEGFSGSSKVSFKTMKGFPNEPSEDDLRRKKIADNLKVAARNRGTLQDFKINIAKFYKSSEENVKDVLEGKRSIRAEEILVLEENFGIHRDEILGEVESGRIERPILIQLEKWINEAQQDSFDDGNTLANKLRNVLLIINKSLKQANSTKEREILCDEILDALDRAIK